MKKLGFVIKAPLFLLLLTITVFIILLVYKSSSGYKTKAAGTGVALTLIPSIISAPAGTDFTVTVGINTNDKTISAAELHLTFDTAKLQAKSITPFGYLPVVLTSGSIGSGTVLIVLGSQPTAPQKGSGILATVIFTSLSNDSTLIEFDSHTQVAGLGETNNVVDTMTGAQVNTGLTTITPSIFPTSAQHLPLWLIPTTASHISPIPTEVPQDTGIVPATVLQQTIIISITPHVTPSTTPIVPQHFQPTMPQPTIFTPTLPLPSVTPRQPFPSFLPTASTTPVITSIPTKSATAKSFIDYILNIFGIGK